MVSCHTRSRLAIVIYVSLALVVNGLQACIELSEIIIFRLRHCNLLVSHLVVFI